MASSSKPTAVHFALVFFVMTTLILALVTYLTAKEYAKAAQSAKEEADNAAQATTALNNSLSDVELLKTLTGYQFEEIGAGDSAAENTVAGALRKDLVSLGREHVQPSPQTPTVADTLQSLRSALNSVEAEVQTQQTGLQTVETRLTDEQTMHLNEREKIKASQEDSEAQLQKLVTDQNEKLAEKDREIAKWRDEYRRELVEKQNLRDDLERIRKEKDSVIADLENVVDFLRDQLNELENLSFDKPDGKIVRVDNTTRHVWINLGSADNLRNQTSFSVYTRDHRGVGRGREDIKAKIEVTEIRGPHLAEARILTEDIQRPILAEDPVYSPLYSKGLKEHFSFVGVLDLDGDGKSDRELLHDIIENAGAGIEVEVDDKGLRDPEEGRLTVKSKFLVIGGIEDPSEFPGFADKQEEIQKVMEELQALQKEARRQGIRVVSFGDFLNYIGYEAQQRLYIAGEDRPFNLKYGARSTGTSEGVGSSRLSSGQVSEIFNKKRTGQKASSGTTSKLYKN